MEKIKVLLKSDDFFKNFLVTFGGQLIVMILSFLLNKIISNSYSVEQFGVYNLIRRLSSIISFFMLMAMGITIPKYVAEAQTKKDNLLISNYIIDGLVIILSASIITIGILLLIKNYLAIFVFNSINFAKYILPVCLFSLGTTLSTYAYSYYSGINNFVKYNCINVSVQIILIIASLVIDSMLYLFYVWSAFLLLYSIYEIYIICNKHTIKINSIKVDFNSLKELLLYSIPRVPGELVLFAYNLIPLTIITGKFGLKDVGLFSASLSINSIITPFFSMIGIVLLPMAGRSIAEKTERQFNYKINFFAIIYLIISIFAIIFIYSFGEIILKILFSDEYVLCLPILKITILSIIPYSMYLLLRNPIDGVSKFPYNTINLLISFFVYVLILLFSNNIETCAFSLIISYSILGFLSIFSWNFINKK